MGDLDAGHGALLLDEGRYAGEHGDVIVPIDSVVARCDASARFHSGCFHHYEAGAAYCAAAEMYQVPVRCKSVDAGVLAHGGDGDAVTERDFAES